MDIPFLYEFKNSKRENAAFLESARVKTAEHRVRFVRVAILHVDSDTTLEFSMAAHKTEKGREIVKKGAFRFLIILGLIWVHIQTAIKIYTVNEKSNFFRWRLRRDPIYKG